MCKYVRRNCLRNHNNAPIIYSKCNTDMYHAAHMQNRSVTGMYFESKQALNPEVEITIKLENYPAGMYQTEADSFYRAKVKWCKAITDSDTLRYGIGVQYLPNVDLSSAAEPLIWNWNTA